MTVDPVLIEQLADAAWPAAEQATLGPWKLRATHGVTRRANSVFTAGHADVPANELERLIDEAERFYAMRSLPAVFQISAATGAKELDAMLHRRGYAINGQSEVWAVSTFTMSRHHNEQKRTQHAGTVALATTRILPTRQGSSAIAWQLRREDQPDMPWFDCAFDEIAERRRVHEQIVRRVPPPRLYVAAIADGIVAGCGMATSTQGHTGIFCMATRAAYQRRGIALSLVRELCEWPRSLGDQCAFLQVMTDNAPAKALYQKVGFKHEYAYHYRVKSA